MEPLKMSKSSITTEMKNQDTEELLPTVTPGEILTEEFLKPLGITEYRLAKDIGVTPRRINEIVHGRRTITVDTAYRFSQYFGTSVEVWLGLQARHDLEVFQRSGKLPTIPRCKAMQEAA